MTRHLASLLLALAILSAKSYAQSPACNLVPEKPTVEFITNCIAQLALSAGKQENIVQEQTERIEFLQTRFQELASLVPSGAVVAFDRREGCPDGWDPFTKGAGRVIVGEGEGDGVYRVFDDRGGKSVVRLEPNQMPEHRHVNRWLAKELREGDVGWIGKLGVIGETVQTANTGGGQAHENMPPFIVLYYCKKR